MMTVRWVMPVFFLFFFYIALVSVGAAFAEQASVPVRKQASVLSPRKLVDAAVSNSKKYPWAKEIQQRIADRAEPWLKCSDDELWSAMFGPTITLTWMVWSNGYCPKCKNDVKMYTWLIDIWKDPFKVKCPHCSALFPTNDFGKFYNSGLDEKAVFDPKRADRSLLFNAKHPDPNDPEHLFGVDDGEGFLQDGHRWRFIGYYLEAGQWRQKIVAGVQSLAEAYVVTGDKAYAHKAAVLLDRVADLYPTFDYNKIGLVYEVGGNQGYVSVWHDACHEIKILTMAYDRIFDEIKKDDSLIPFLSQRAKQYGLSNPKKDFADIQANIEDRIFRDTLANEPKIRSNYPTTPVAMLMMKAVLEWPANREEILGMVSKIIETSAKEDGMTGEKGMYGYTAIFPQSLAVLLATLDRMDPALLDDIYAKYPIIHKTFRFHADTWCLEKYYPTIGDTGRFAGPAMSYSGMTFAKTPSSIDPSMFQLAWRLYELTKDPIFVQLLYKANANSTEGLPHDLCADNPSRFEKQVKKVIRKYGTDLKLGDVNLEQWGLSILRSGEGDDRRAVWMDHDSGGGHSHKDALNIGLFAKGIDLLPDFGYPPVGYGGWGSAKAAWYTQTAAHNTVVVDGQDKWGLEGKCTLWASGKQFDAVRVSVPGMIENGKFERLIAKIDISDQDAYVLDVFQVLGGKDHVQFFTSNFGKVTSQGLVLSTSMEYGYVGQLRNFVGDPKPNPGWSVDWAIEDRYKVLPNDASVNFRYTGLTEDCAVALGECWIDYSTTYYGGTEAWIPRLMIRHREANPPTSSCFVGALEPYVGQPFIKSARRFAARDSKNSEGVAVELEDGRRQFFIYPLVQDCTRSNNIERYDEVDLETDAEICFASTRDGKVEHLALCNGTFLKYGDFHLALKEQVNFFEAEVKKGKIKAITGALKMLVEKQ